MADLNKTIRQILIWLVISCHFQVKAQTSGYAKSIGVHIYYQTFGDGHPILIINGGPGFNSEGFQDIAQKIANLGYQTILYDQRGTGKSKMDTLSNDTVSMDMMANDIEALRTTLNIESWIVFGHSFGGIMANYYASQFPERIIAMIQSSSGGIDLHLLENAGSNLYARLTETEIDSLNYWRREYGQSNSEKDRYEYNKYLASAYVYNKEFIPIIQNRLMQGNLYLNALVWNDLRRINYDCKNSFKSFNRPVLIIQGKQDIIPEDLAYRAAKVFKNSKVVLLDNCSHYGWLDQPKNYLKEIESFLQSI